MGTEASCRLARLVALTVAAASAGCTTFAGAELVPDDGGATGASTASTGTGGEGGGLPLNDPDAYLPLLDATDLCALAGECPLLAASIVVSIGLPIVHVDAAAQRIDVSYSACLDWLTAPIAPGRIGFTAQQDLLYDVLPSGCAGGIDFLPFEALAETDARCEGMPAPTCDGDTLVDCAGSVAVACAAPPFSPLTACIEDASGARCGVPNQCDDTEPASCDGSYAVVCDDGVATAFDCTSIGLECSAASPGRCSGESGVTACTALGAEACNAGGERAALCIGAIETETDCDAAGLVCVEEPPYARCVAPGATCSPYDPDVDICEGDVLHACVGGARVDVDCAAIGRRCHPAKSVTLSGETVVRSGRCATSGL